MTLGHEAWSACAKMKKTSSLTCCTNVASRRALLSLNVGTFSLNNSVNVALVVCQVGLPSAM